MTDTRTHLQRDEFMKRRTLLKTISGGGLLLLTPFTAFIAGADIKNGLSLNVLSLIREYPWKEYVIYNKLGFLGVLIFSVRKYIKSVPDLGQPVIPWPLFEKPIIKSEPLRKEYISENRSLYDLANSCHHQQSKIGRNRSKIIKPTLLRESLNLIFINYFVYRVVVFFLRRKNKHNFSYAGVSIRHLIEREKFIKKSTVKNKIKYILIKLSVYK